MTDPRLTAALASFLATLGVTMAAGLRSSEPLVALLLLAATTVAGLVLAGTDLALRVYVVGLSIPFVAAPLYRAGLDPDLADIWWLLTAWLAGWAVGVALTRLTDGPQGPRRAALAHGGADTTPFLVFGWFGIALQAMSFSRHGSQFSAQLNGVVDTGLDTMLLAATPAAVAVAFWSSRASGPGGSGVLRLTPTLALLAQSWLLLLSGFRAAAPGYLLTVWLVGRWCTRGQSRQMSFPRLTVLMAGLVFLFLFASNYRSDIAASLGRSSGGTVALTLTNLPATVAQRLDYSVYLRQALRRAGDPGAQAVVSPSEQVTSLVPRLLWPSKPPVYYGRNVAEVFFDVPPGSNSAETITWLGDLYVQGRAVLIFLAGIVVGLALSLALRHLERPGILAVAAYYVLVAMTLNTEAPIILALGNGLRVFGVLLAVHAVGRLLRRCHVPKVAPLPLAR